MLNIFKKKIRIVTHSGRFHADEAFACATLALYLNKKGTPYRIIRTRDSGIIESGDIVLDVGGIYNPEKGRFDHHQNEGAGNRDNGIPFASFGLIWKHYGVKVCESDVVANIIDSKIVQAVDALDNGKQITNFIIPDVREYNLQDIIDCYLPKTQDLKDYDKNFSKLVEFAKFILTSEIKKAHFKVESSNKVIEMYQATKDKRIIFIDGQYSWKNVLNKFPEPLFAIFQSPDGSWGIHAIRDDMNSFENRKNLPQEWGGLEKEALRKVTGVEDAVFCHRNLFLAVAKSKEGIIQLAELALKK